jgi:hypothetical protein
MSNKEVCISAQYEARKAFKNLKAESAKTDYEMDQEAVRDNRERLKAARLARETANGRVK